MYIEYLSKLIEHIEIHFYRGTYDVCITIGKLLNFNWLLYPNCCLHSYVTDLKILTLEVFTEMLKRIYFAPKADSWIWCIDVNQLLFEYRQLHKFAYEVAVEFHKENSVHSEFINICLLKQSVLKNKEYVKTLFNFLFFAVCLPTSEAIVESWGSSIDCLFKIKPNTKKGLELENTGTVDKLAFIRLNGPPLGFSLKWIYNSALALMFKGDYASHFLHIDRNLKATLIVVDRILSSNEALPNFLN